MITIIITIEADKGASAVKLKSKADNETDREKVIHNYLVQGTEVLLQAYENLNGVRVVTEDQYKAYKAQDPDNPQNAFSA